MRAIRFEAFGAPEVLRVTDVPSPVPKAGTVRIAVRAAGVNPFDAKVRSGAMSGQLKTSFPAGTGLEAAGVVDALGDGVEGVAVGDAVFGAGRWTVAQQAVLRSWLPKPDGLPFDEAAAWPVAVETAVRVLDALALHRGDALLISGAAGGVGTAVVQLAVGRGLRVVGSASEANLQHLTDVGATAIAYGDGWPERASAAAPGGFAGALDLAGAGVVPDLVALVGDAAQVVSIADFSAPSHGARVSSSSGDTAVALREAVALAADGRFTMGPLRRFGLHEAVAAHAAVSAGHGRGKVVITID